MAPQNLICPQGKRYPINAVAMDKIRIVTPTFHVSINFGDPKYSPRAMCKYIHKKKAEAPLACKFRINHPPFTSRVICAMEEKAKSM